MARGRATALPSNGTTLSLSHSCPYLVSFGEKASFKCGGENNPFAKLKTREGGLVEMVEKKEKKMKRKETKGSLGRKPTPMGYLGKN